MKRIILVASIIILFALCAGCTSPIDTEVVELSNGTHEIYYKDGNIYTIPKEGFFDWLPYIVDDDYKGVCKMGYIYETSSENCLAILLDGRNYYALRNDYIVKDEASKAILTPYGSAKRIVNDNLDTIDVTYAIDEIYLICEPNNCDHSKTEHEAFKNPIASIVLQNAYDKGLYRNFPVYQIGDEYFVYLKNAAGNDICFNCNRIASLNMDSLLKELNL